MAFGESLEGVANTVFNAPMTITSNGVSEYKPVGFEMDWSSVTAAASDVTLTGGQVIKAGTKYVRYGSVVYKHTNGKYRVATDSVPTELVKGETFYMQYTITDQDDTSPFFGGAIDGGRVYKQRLLIGGAGQPTVEAAQAAMPRISFFV